MANIDRAQIKDRGIRVDKPIKGDPVLAAASQERRFIGATKVNNFASNLIDQRQAAEERDFIQSAISETELDILNNFERIKKENIDTPDRIPELFDETMSGIIDGRTNQARTPALRKSTEAKLDSLFQKYRLKVVTFSHNEGVRKLSDNLDLEVNRALETVRRLSPNFADFQRVLARIRETISRADFVPSERRAAMLDSLPGKLASEHLKSLIAQDLQSGKDLLKNPEFAQLLNPIQIGEFKKKIAQMEKATQVTNSIVANKMIDDEVINREQFGKADPGAIDRIERIGGKKALTKAFFAFDEADKKHDTNEQLLPKSPAEKVAFIEKLFIAANNSDNSTERAEIHRKIIHAKIKIKEQEEAFAKNGKQFVKRHFSTLDETKQLAMQEHLGSNSPDHFDDTQMAALSDAWNKTNTPQEKGEFLRGLDTAAKESKRPVEELFEQLIKSGILPPNYAAGINYIKDREAFETFITAMSVGVEDLAINASLSPVFSRQLQRDLIREEFDKYIRAYTADPRRSSTQLTALMNVAERMAMVHVGDSSSMKEAAQRVVAPILDQLHFRTLDGQIIMFPIEINGIAINAAAVETILTLESDFVNNNPDLLEIPEEIIKKFEADITAGIDASFPFIPLHGQLFQIVGELRGQEITPKEVFKQLRKEFRWVIQEGGKTAALKDSVGNTLFYKTPKVKTSEGILVVTTPDPVQVSISEASEKGVLLFGKELTTTVNLSDLVILNFTGKFPSQKVTEQIKEAVRIGGDEGVERLEGLKNFVNRARTFTESSRKRTLFKLADAIQGLKKIEAKKLKEGKK